MPRPTSSFSSKLAGWLKQLEDSEKHHFEYVETDKVFCNVCVKSFACSKKFQLDQHISTAFHQASVKRSGGTHQARIDSMRKPDSFNNELCNALLAADIPLNKLENPVFKGFLEKYCGRAIPSVWTIRNRSIQESYSEVIASIQGKLKNKFIWMGVDETTDRCGRFVANVVVGALDGNETEPHLIMSKELTVANNATITQLVLNALSLLWPKKEQEQIAVQFAVFLSDAAPYMIKAGKNLKGTYPGLIHVTCVAHALHRVAETVRSSFKDVDRLVGFVKAIFKKSPYRIRTYHEMLPNIPLPPEPVLTRWGTWLDASHFLCENFVGISTVINSFDPDDAECIKKAQLLLEKDSVKTQLTDISSNFGFLSGDITLLETRNQKLTEAVDVIKNVRIKLMACDSRIKDKIVSKLKSVVQNNPGLSSMEQVAEVLKGEGVSNGLDPSLMAAMKYCPLTSVELERSFSMAKALLTDRRCNLTMENFEKHLVCHYNMCQNV